MQPPNVTRAHVAQSAAAGVFILLAFWAMHALKSEMAIASLGASTFIVFCYPAAETTRPRIMIGGYCVGVACGLLCGVLTSVLPAGLPIPGYILACAVAVALVTFSMTILNLKHPPAAALAIAITINDHRLILAPVALGCILLLSVIKTLLGKYLRNL